MAVVMQVSQGVPSLATSTRTLSKPYANFSMLRDDLTGF
jgi:hypothetical protein